MSQIKIFAGASLLVSLLTMSFPSQAEITFSRYRVSLDDQQRNMSLLVSNSGDNRSRCTMSFVDQKIESDGTGSALKKGESMPNSAAQMVRFSPRRVTIPGRGSQTVRLSLKRQRNAEPGEFVSYLRLNCVDISEEATGFAARPRIQAQINYNIPVVARRGKLEATAVLAEPKLENDRLFVDLARQGSRSVYGELTVTDDSSGKVIGIKNGVSIYLPVENRRLTVPLKETPQGPLTIRFKESAIDGGEIEVTTNLGN